MADQELRGPRQAGDLRRPTNTLYQEQPKSTIVLAAHARNNPHYTSDCGHRSPRTRHVEIPGGPARYLCRRCMVSALAAEAQAATRALARAQLDALFGGRCPRVACGLGGAHRAQVLMPTLPATTPARIVFANFAETGLERRGTWRG